LLAHDWSKHVTWPNIPRLKLGNIRGYSPSFKSAHVAKNLKDIYTVACIWHKNMLGYFSLDIIILFLEAHSFPTFSENCSLLGTDNVRRQIPEHISTRNGGYCLFISPLLETTAWNLNQNNKQRNIFLHTDSYLRHNNVVHTIHFLFIW